MNMSSHRGMYYVVPSSGCGRCPNMAKVVKFNPENIFTCAAIHILKKINILGPNLTIFAILGQWLQPELGIT